MRATRRRRASVGAGVVLLLGVGAIALVSLLPAGDDESAVAPTIPHDSAPTPPSTSSTSTSIPAPVGPIEGALPDGRAYIVSGAHRGEIQSISAPILIFIRGDSLLGAVDFQKSPGPAEPLWDGDRLLVPAGEWTVAIDVSREVLDQLGDGGRDTIAGAIRGYTTLGMPVLDLSFPLRFATTHDEWPPRAISQAEVAYESFAVWPLCDEESAVACSTDQTVQAVPLGEGTAPPEGLGIESTYRGEQVRYLVLGVSTEVGFDRFGSIDHTTTMSDLTRLWSEFRMAGDAPNIDLDRYVVVFYNKSDDACPDDLALLTLDGDRLIPKFVRPGGACLQPLVPTAYAVSIDRATLPERFVAVLPAYFPGSGAGYDEVRHDVYLTSAP